MIIAFSLNGNRFLFLMHRMAFNTDNLGPFSAITNKIRYIDHTPEKISPKVAEVNTGRGTPNTNREKKVMGFAISVMPSLVLKTVYPPKTKEKNIDAITIKQITAKK